MINIEKQHPLSLRTVGAAAPILVLAIVVHFFVSACKAPPPPPSDSCLSCSVTLELCTVSSQYTSTGSHPIDYWYTSDPYGTHDQIATWFLGGSGTISGSYSGVGSLTGITSSGNVLKSWSIDCSNQNNTTVLLGLVNIYTSNSNCTSGKELWQLSNMQVIDYNFGPKNCNKVICLNFPGDFTDMGCE